MKKSVSCLLVFILAVMLPVKVFADELKDAKGQLEEAKKSITENKEKLKDIQAEQKSTEEQLKSLDSKMNEISDEIDKLRSSIDLTSEEIENIRAEIEAKLIEIEEQQELLDKRLSAMYKRGNLGYLSVIFTSADFSELLQRTIYVEKIAATDKKLIESIIENKRQFEDKKEGLEVKKAQLEEAKAISAQKLAELDKQSDEKKSFMKKLENDKAAYEKLIEEEEAAAKALKEKIKKLEAIKVSNGKMYCVTGKPYTITSYYGNRLHPVLGTYRFHAGIDIGVYTGTPIYALKDGVVVYSGTMSGYGKVIMIHHGDIISLYAHNSSLVLNEGAQVKGGQLIAYSGNTGLSSGPHLHFEIRKTNGETVDALNYYVR
ncbi:murein hydrolase activator EnvC family protein [Clostridium thermarum]|uniref:murein hydrolase activator EnvC family protein n=1 Tax=Clostridium thermarum TaxID=1716543 RepID=UPI00112034B8|nr:M23 family metallopeptidase [Clostridium thermarum]